MTRAGNLWSSLGGLRSRLQADESGLAAVELALVLPFLLLMLAGLIDASRLISENMQVQSAAQAGADHALRHGWSEPDVRQAIVGAASIGVAADPAPRLMKACVSGTEIVETAAAICPTGEPPGDYVVASARAAFEPLFPWPGILLPQTLSTSIVARIA